jgi:hypothetical protein
MLAIIGSLFLGFLLLGFDMPNSEFLKKSLSKTGMVVYTYIPSYSGSRGKDIESSKSAQTIIKTLSQK